MASNPQTMTPLEALQDRFAIIDLSGEIRVADRHQIDAIKAGKSSNDPTFYKKTDATILMMRELEALSAPSSPRSVINEFWVAPNTTMYIGTAFTPTAAANSLLNFWVGPREGSIGGSCGTILDYLQKIICNEDVASYDYLINFLAHMVQKPEEKPGVMIVLLGKQGTGKGMFFSLLRAIWTRTTLQISDIDMAIGRFNACLERNFAVCMDEALFSGDRKALDRLKSIVTEPTINIEQKYQPARSIQSIHRFFAASNHEQFAHVELDDRRFVFLRVSDAKQQDTIYFRQLNAALQDAETIGAFVHHVQQVDLSDFDVRKRPRTGEHLTQRIKSLQGIERFWYEILVTENIAAQVNQFEEGLHWSTPMFVPSTALSRYYREFNKNAQRFQTVQVTDLVTNIRRLCPSVQQTRQLHQASGNAIKTQKRGLLLPDIAIARAEFESIMGGIVPWL